MKDFLFRMLGILAFGVTFVPVYYAENMVGECIDPIQWETIHSHPEMPQALLWIACAFPFLLMGLKHGLLFNTEKGLPSWKKAFAGAMFWLIPAIAAYASILGTGCPYAIKLQYYLLAAAFILAIGSFALYLYTVRKENTATNELLN